LAHQGNRRWPDMQEGGIRISVKSIFRMIMKKG